MSKESIMNRVLVVWQSPKTGIQHIIGELWRTNDSQFAFGYRLENLPNAERDKFCLPLEFPKRKGIEDPYISQWLFATFSQRIPSPKRPDYDKIMESWNIKQEERHDPLAILIKSGGKLITDNLGIIKYRS